jgi:hypothetical protein
MAATRTDYPGQRKAIIEAHVRADEFRAVSRLAVTV